MRIKINTKSGKEHELQVTESEWLDLTNALDANKVGTIRLGSTGFRIRIEDIESVQTKYGS